MEILKPKLRIVVASDANEGLNSRRGTKALTVLGEEHICAYRMEDIF